MGQSGTEIRPAHVWSSVEPESLACLTRSHPHTTLHTCQWIASGCGCSFDHECVYGYRSLSHPKLVQLYGVCTQQRPIYLVTEFMELGCLLNYIRQRRGTLSAQNLLSVCHDISQGMQYLEENRFIHRDLVRNTSIIKT